MTSPGGKGMHKNDSPAQSIICEGIRRHCLLEFEYHGLLRVVQPYCHGISTRGVEVVRAIQIRGSSRSGWFGFGKLWRLAEIANPRLLDEIFQPDDPGYNPQDSGMVRIHCRV